MIALFISYPALSFELLNKHSKDHAAAASKLKAKP
jgi:hypothetical protein